MFPLLLALCAAASVVTAEASEPSPPALLTNLSQLRHWADQDPSVVHPFRIEAEVCDADPASSLLVVRDDSGVEFVQLDFPKSGLQPGAIVCLEGSGCALKPKRFGLTFVPGLVVNNDGRHGYRAESGTVFLSAGRHPITLEWFNGIGDVSLDVEYEGPGLLRQRIPDAVLSRGTNAGAPRFPPGLNFRCYQGEWERLPDFGSLQPVKSGTVPNFDLAVRTRPAAVALAFDGFITVPCDGAYTFHVASDDGSRLFVGKPSVTLRVLSNAPSAAVAGTAPIASARSNGRWSVIEGIATYVGDWRAGGELLLRVGNDNIRATFFGNSDVAPDIPLHSLVRVSGLYREAVTDDESREAGVLQVSSWKAVQPVPVAEFPAAGAVPGGGKPVPPGVARTAPVRTIAEIKTLTPDAAKQQLPVSIRGVVTTTLPTVFGAVVQDATKGIYVSLENISELDPLHRGDFCQIEGVTGPGLFAPVIVASQVTRLGSGELPPPQRATWDQLVNGSLDTQYAELEGVVIAVRSSAAVLLTEGGRLTLDLSDLRSATLARYENAHVRIRGCVFGPFNAETHKLDPGTIRIGSPIVQVLRPAPRNLFDAPSKSIGEFLLYDSKAAPFRLLKVSGQIVHGRPGEFFLTDGTNGMRVTSRSSDHFAVGELVDAVGFAELGGPAAELKEAVLRQTGRAPLPAAIKLAPEQLLHAGHAGKLVQVDATLMNQWRDGAEQVLELQSGFVGFRARINPRGQAVALPPSGSRLALTGVYSPQGNRTGGQTVNGFELLLHSPAGVRVLATPPWWNLRRVLILAGILAALLCVVLVWNKQLWHQVQERTRKLEIEIRHRERAEQLRAAEAERARIARDLHDELGTSLTEVSLLASAGLDESRTADKRGDRFQVIAEKARGLVSGLDVIVWAVDPKRDSLQSFADYLGSYAKELLSASGLVCRLRIPIECDAIALPGTARHSLFLAVKEALNNVIRHARATEVELQMKPLAAQLEIVIADNGCGFDWNSIRRGNGLTNLRERLETLRGECHIESLPGRGTTVKLTVPWAVMPAGEGASLETHPTP